MRAADRDAGVPPAAGAGEDVGARVSPRGLTRAPSQDWIVNSWSFPIAPIVNG
jgi:hypothetical protein